MDIHSIYSLLGRNFREKRSIWWRGKFSDCKTVLDIGGAPGSWREWRPLKLILLNIRPFHERLAAAQHIQADALALPFRDKSVDLAMSNSVIEHVPDQGRFAAESLRVGKRVYCQTPSKWFPVEPHLLTLFIHWLPKSCFTPFVHRYLTVHGWITKPDAATTQQLRNEINLLTKQDLRRLFPNCRIKTERFLGFPKSYMVFSEELQEQARDVSLRTTQS